MRLSKVPRGEELATGGLDEAKSHERRDLRNRETPGRERTADQQDAEDRVRVQAAGEPVLGLPEVLRARAEQGVQLELSGQKVQVDLRRREQNLEYFPDRCTFFLRKFTAMSSNFLGGGRYCKNS